MNDVKYVGYAQVEHNGTLAVGHLFPKAHLKIFPYFKASVPFAGRLLLEPIRDGLVNDDVFCYWDRDGAMHIPHAIMEQSAVSPNYLVDIYWKKDNSIEMVRSSLAAKRINQRAAEHQKYIWCYDIE